MMAATFSSADRTISLAAQRLGIGDPTVIAEELTGVDVEGLHEWFSHAASIQVRLFQGAAQLSEAGPILAAGWSNPAPRIHLTSHHDAAMVSRQVVGDQVDAADLAGSILRQSRSAVDGELTAAQAALIATGWPPGQDLYSWALDNGRLEPVTAIVAGLTGRLTDLRLRNERALADLALALRSDPRDSVQALPTGGPPASGAMGNSVPGSPSGGIDQTSGADRTNGVDQANLDRLAVDLQSTDLATQLMARGVQVALQEAAAHGDVAQLLAYESANSGSQGRAAIGIGDITEADNVAVLAPGIGNAPVNMADGIGTAAAVRDAAQQRSPGDRTTVVAWYGYDMPLAAPHGVPVDPAATIANTTAVVDDANAQAGGQLLAGDLEQFREWAPDTARFIAAGFSMGSTTVSAAAARGAKLDDMVLLASPGAGNDVDTVADYSHVPPEHVYAVEQDDDPITTRVADLTSALLGNLISPTLLPDFTPFGPDPADSDFGAQLVDVGANTPEVSVDLIGPLAPFSDVVSNQVLDLVTNHRESKYYSGASLDAVAAVVTGQYGAVPIKPGR
ncbi:MAG: alpha/beta hydrolase [Nakamurella sp.]